MGRKRRSLLFIPGNNPGMLQNGSVFGADCVIFDLEDAVAPVEKDTARLLVRNALKTLDYGNTEKIVRVNPVKSGFFTEDLKMIIPAKPDVIMPPKTQSGNDIQEIDAMVSKLENAVRMPSGSIKLIPLIESALGVEKAFEIATASKRVVGIFLGAEDLTADINAKRTKSSEEIFYSRSRIVVAAKAAQVQAIDTPFTDVNDEEGLLQDAVFARKIGFDGKTAISPRHIEPINKAFTPSKEEVEYAQRVLDAINRAEKEGKGAISLDGKMIDAPIVSRARQILEIIYGDLGGEAGE